MKYSKDLLVIFIVVILAAVGFVVLETTLNNEKAHIDGKYNYTLDKCTSFIATDGSTQTAPDGQMYVVATVTLLNIDWYTGIDNDASSFELEVELSGEMKKIQSAPDTSLYPENRGAITCMPGEQGQNCYLYLVPADTDMSGANILFTGQDKLAYDQSLSM